MAVQAIRVEGLNRTVRALRDIGVPATEISGAGYEAGSIVAAEARSLAPVKTGALRGSIRVARQQRRVVVRAGSARVPYANPIHWGWFKRNIKPNEFFSRALKTNINEVYESYFDSLRGLLRKYGGN